MRVVKQGNSFYIAIPRKIVRKYDIRVGNTVELKDVYKGEDNSIILVYRIRK